MAFEIKLWTCAEQPGFLSREHHVVFSSSNEVMPSFKNTLLVSSSNITYYNNILLETLFSLMHCLPVHNAWLHWTIQWIVMGLAGSGTLLMIIKWTNTTSEEFITSLNISWSMMYDTGWTFFPPVSLSFWTFAQIAVMGPLVKGQPLSRFILYTSWMLIRNGTRSINEEI